MVAYGVWDEEKDGKIEKDCPVCGQNEKELELNHEHRHSHHHVSYSHGENDHTITPSIVD